MKENMYEIDSKFEELIKDLINNKQPTLQIPEDNYEGLIVFHSL